MEFSQIFHEEIHTKGRRTNNLHQFNSVFHLPSAHALTGKFIATNIQPYPLFPSQFHRFSSLPRTDDLLALTHLNIKEPFLYVQYQYKPDSKDPNSITNMEQWTRVDSSQEVILADTNPKNQLYVKELTERYEKQQDQDNEDSAVTSFTIVTIAGLAKMNLVLSAIKKIGDLYRW